MDTISCNWLPEEVARDAAEQEPHRFRALVVRFLGVARQACDSSDLNRWAPVAQWIPLLNNFLLARKDYDMADIQKLVEALLEVAMASAADTEVQVRCTETLTRLLRRYRKELQLEIQWRPLYDLLQALLVNAPPKVEGLSMWAIRQSGLFRLVQKARRFFPPSAAAEIWALHRPALLQPDTTAAHMALGWLVLFFPTQHLCKLPPPGQDAAPASPQDDKPPKFASSSVAAINDWLPEWIGCWVGSTVHCYYWLSLWLDLLSRVAKHDHQGVINWEPHVAAIATQALWVVGVPVGTAVASVPIRRNPPPIASVLFSSMTSSRQKHLAILLVHLLKSSPAQPAPHAEAAQAALEGLITLTEQYFHPSNGGDWTSRLSRVLHHLVKAFMKHLCKLGPDPPPWQAQILPAARQQFVRGMLRLASRAQFSKDSGLSTTAVRVLAQLAYVEPGQVGPLVLSRLRTALQSDTATHQLATSVMALARCTRPLLLTGWQPEDAEGETFAQVLAEAMMALLPGIDANDEAKTTAVLTFYAAVLESLPRLEAGDGPDDGAPSGGRCYRLPLYLEEWVEELLQRQFQLLENLDSGPRHRADAAAQDRKDVAPGESFLMQDESYFVHLNDMLLLKLPQDMAEAAISRILRFVIANNLWAVGTECGSLVMASASRCPNLTMRLLVRPLLQQLLAEVPPSGLPSVSENLESALRWQVHLVSEACRLLPAAHKLAMIEDVEAASKALLACDARGVQMLGASMLGSLAGALTSSSLPLTELQDIPTTPSGISAWIDKEGTGIAAPRWDVPSGDALAAGQALAERHLRAAAQKLQELCAGDGAAAALDGKQFKTQLYGALGLVRGLLAYVIEAMPDFQLAPPPAEPDGSAPTPLHVSGALGPSFKGGLRELLAEALAQACRAVKGYDSNLGEAAGVAAGLVLLNGHFAYSMAQSETRDIKRCRHRTAQPALAAAYLGPDVPWKQRQPVWLLSARLRVALIWRTSQANYRCWAATTRPAVPSAAALPALYLTLLREVAALSLHPYTEVSNNASIVTMACCKRFPALVPHLLPLFLGVLSATDAPLGTSPADLLPRLQAAALAAGGADAVPPSGGSAATAALAALAVGGGAAAAAAAAATAASSGGSSGSSGTQNEREARVIATCRVLNGTQAFWRLAFRDPDAFACLLNTLLSVRHHITPATLLHITQLLLSAATRFRQPPALDAASPAYHALLAHLLQLAVPASAGGTAWRQPFLANLMLLQLLPPPGHPLAPQLAAHFLQLLISSDILKLRQVAASGLYVLLLDTVDYAGPPPSAICDVVAAALSAEGAGEKLTRQLSLMHSALEAAEADKDKDEGRGRMSSFKSSFLTMNFEELAVHMARSGIEQLEYQMYQAIPHKAGEGYFICLHAKLIRVLATTAPQATFRALKAPMERICTEEVLGQPGADKTELATAAEVASGLLASGALVARNGSGGSAAGAAGQEGAWLWGVLEKALRLAPLEVADSWGCGLRYAMRSLLTAAAREEKQQPGNGWEAPPGTSLPALGSLLQALISYPGGAGAQQLLAAIKRQHYLRHLVMELHSGPSFQDAPPQLREFLGAVLEEVSALTERANAALREPLGSLLAHLLAHLHAPHPAARRAPDSSQRNGSPHTPLVMEVDGDEDSLLLLPAGNPRALQQRTDALSSSLVSSFLAASEKLQELRGSASSASTAAAAPLQQSSQQQGDGPEEEEMEIVEAAEAEGADAGAGRAGGASAMEDAAGDSLQHAIAQVGVGLQLTSAALHLGSAGLRPLLLAALPALLRLQELSGPHLQQLALESKSAFVLAKYLPAACPADVAATVAALLQGGAAEQWSTRAAALVHLQYWWFHHHFLLGPQQVAQLQDMVVARLQDPRTEVRSIAADTLSGLLRALPPAAGEALRASLLASAAALFSRRSRRRRLAAGVAEGVGEGGAGGPSVVERQACVQGLRALLMSSPYDFVPWMPPVLMALVAAGGDANVGVRREVAAVLGEFKRTHEQDSLAQLRATMGPDDWDSLQQMTSHASYFA